MLAVLVVAFTGAFAHAAQATTPGALSSPITAAQAETPTPEPTPIDGSRLSIEFLREQEYPGSDIVIEQKLAPGANYDRYLTSYRSEGLKIYALLTVPRGQRPASGWPVIIFNHGYIPPAQYRTTERYVAYVDGFARQGYIVFRPDYRGHGNSEGSPTGAYGSPGYVIDVLNAVASMKRYEAADPERIGMWGHSMGGWITLRAMVVSPDIKAGVIWGGVVGAYEDLLAHWRRNRPGAPPGSSASRGGWRNSLVRQFGEPSENPDFWRGLSPNYFLTDLSGPIQLHHAQGDASVPVKLSEILVEQGKASGMPVELFSYRGDNHNISGNFGRAMAQSVAFFDRWVKQPVDLREADGPTVYPRVDNVNLRAEPSTNSRVVGQLRIGESLPVIGRNADGSWWRVRTDDGAAWIAASVALAAKTAEVPVVAVESSPSG
jgi:dienelactone hydrolase